MASDISSGGSSKFLAARKLFRANSANAKEEVEVFVEDEIDSIFWRHFFAQHENNKLFRIRVLRNGNNELCGKDALIQFVNISSLGPNKLMAIDSDYDYIIDNYHTYTNDLRACKYVIHTNNTYSIENYKIVPSILKEAIYLTSFCDHIAENVETMLLQTSQILFKLFTIHLFSINKKDNIYKLSDFKSDLNKVTYKNDELNENTKEYINKRIVFFKPYIDRNRLEYEDFLNQLKTKGVKEYNCWQFINGHTALEEIGIKIVTNLACKYRGEYISWVYANVTDQKRRNNLLMKYNNSTRVNDGIHQLKDRIREILYDIKPDCTFEPSIDNSMQIVQSLQ